MLEILEKTLKDLWKFLLRLSYLWLCELKTKLKKKLKKNPKNRSEVLSEQMCSRSSVMESRGKNFFQLSPEKQGVTL